MYFINELDYMKIYRGKFALPIDMKNKRKNSCVFLLTPNIESSINLLNNPIMNPNYFESYYIEKEVLYYINQEGVIEPDEYGVINENSYMGLIEDEYKVEDTHITISLEDGNQCILLFNEYTNNDEEVIMEASNNSNKTALRKILYNERFKTPKDTIAVYDKVKEEVPYIHNTFLHIDKYKKKNLFLDLSYYSQAFFKNNMYKLDKAAMLYYEIMCRFINDNRLQDYNTKTVLVPLDDYIKDKDINSLFNYKLDINPLSVILYAIRFKPSQLERIADLDFLFLFKNKYVKINFANKFIDDIPKIKLLFTRMNSSKEDVLVNNDSPSVIKANIIDKLEKGRGIKVSNLTGNSGEIEKDKLVEKIDNAASRASDVDNAIENLEDDIDIKQIIANLSTQEDPVKISAARAGRISKINNEFLDSKVNNQKVSDLINANKKIQELPKTSIKVDSVNDEWENMQYINFEKAYNLESDIYAIFESLLNKSNPVVIRSIEVENTSTTEDYKDTYILSCEDVNGKRFSLKIDIPHLIDNKFMKIGGNEKTINGQLMLLPISKTDEDTVQMVSNYNKIFIRRYGASGKSTVITDRIMKTLKSKENKIKVFEGDCSGINSKYELPIDYIDLSQEYVRLESTNTIIYFNQDEIRELYDVDESKGIPIGYDKKSKKVIYYEGDPNTISGLIKNILASDSSVFAEYYALTKPATKYSYSKASILNNQIPLIVIMSYNEGLIKTMNKAHIKYKLMEKKPPRNEIDYDSVDFIKFKDGFIMYELDYNSSLLMNGLKECDTPYYSLGEINEKGMYLDFLDNFGGRILADGLDNFYDCFIDPMTLEVLNRYELPTDYIELMAYANLLLSDNKYIRHTDLHSNRYRTNELIAGYLYKAISDSYADYSIQLKRNKKDATMTIKQSAVIDGLMADPTSSDLSTLNAVNELESMNACSFKGLSGMNSDRSYGLDKRTYDRSMINILGSSTGFAGNVGITRQATVDMNIEGRGYLKISDNPEKEMSITKTMTATEALTPFGLTRDDPTRQAMNFIQTAKHTMRIQNGTPQLITTGMDQALPYMITNTFAYKAKKAGKVEKVTDNYMIIKYNDGTNDYVDLRSNVKKNSNGGFYTSVQLSTDLKPGKTFKENDILAYDKLSFSNKIGDMQNIAYNLGAFKKIAIMSSDESFEDSAIISEELAEDLASDVVICKEVVLPKNTNILQMVKKGDPVQEGDPLIIFQNAFEEDDVNLLLKNLSDDVDEVSDLGRIPVKSKVTGSIEDIKIYRTVDKDQLSPSIRKKINEIDKETADMVKALKQYKIDSNKLDRDKTLDTTGKLKNARDSVIIEFYLKYHDKMSVGDKLIYHAALKGVVKDIFPEGDEPYTDFRPDEKIHSILSIASINARMVTSILINGGINKALIELDRKNKELAGLKWEFI